MKHNQAESTYQLPAADQELLTALAKKLSPSGALGIEATRQPHLKEVAERGRPFTERVTVTPGAAGECHQNAAKLWAEDPKKNRLATGYALAHVPLGTENGPGSLRFWVVHSWVLRGKRLIETTVPREAYFGVVLSAPAAYRFFSANVLARECPGGEPPPDFLSRYPHLRPVVMEALREGMEELTPEDLLDLLIANFSFLGEEAAPLIERVRHLKESGNLSPEQVAFLTSYLLQLPDLYERLHQQPGKPRQ